MILWPRVRRARPENRVRRPWPFSERNPHRGQCFQAFPLRRSPRQTLQEGHARRPPPLVEVLVGPDVGPNFETNVNKLDGECDNDGSMSDRKNPAKTAILAGFAGSEEKGRKVAATGFGLRPRRVSYGDSAVLMGPPYLRTNRTSANLLRPASTSASCLGVSVLSRLATSACARSQRDRVRNAQHLRRRAAPSAGCCC